MSIDIDKRTSSFSVTIIYLINKLPTNTAGLAIANQLVRSGTSIGANVAEAMGAHTKTEFTYKMNVVKSEAKETKYWLNLIQDTGYRIQDTGYRIQDTGYRYDTKK